MQVSFDKIIQKEQHHRKRMPKSLYLHPPQTVAAVCYFILVKLINLSAFLLLSFLIYYRRCCGFRCFLLAFLLLLSLFIAVVVVFVVCCYCLLQSLLLSLFTAVVVVVCYSRRCLLPSLIFVGSALLHLLFLLFATVVLVIVVVVIDAVGVRVVVVILVEVVTNLLSGTLNSFFSCSATF